MNGPNSLNHVQRTPCRKQPTISTEPGFVETNRKIWQTRFLHVWKTLMVFSFHAILCCAPAASARRAGVSWPAPPGAARGPGSGPGARWPRPAWPASVENYEKTRGEVRRRGVFWTATSRRWVTWNDPGSKPPQPRIRKQKTAPERLFLVGKVVRLGSEPGGQQVFWWCQEKWVEKALQPGRPVDFEGVGTWQHFEIHMRKAASEKQHQNTTPRTFKQQKRVESLRALQS